MIRRAGPGPLVVLVATVCRLWWRRLTQSVGVVASILLAALAVIGVASFWLVIWPQVHTSLETVLMADRVVRGTLFTILVLSFTVVCALVRVLMLAFDFVSRDLRLLVALAPLTRTQKALVQVMPDWLASVLLVGSFASVGMVGYAAASTDFTIIEALVWVLALVTLVGCASAFFEAVLTRVFHDNDAARGGAATLTLVAICGLLATAMRSIVDVRALAGNAASQSTLR